MIANKVAILFAFGIITVAAFAEAGQLNTDYDPIVLATLQQTCANEHGGHLNEALVRLNYHQFAQLFKRNGELHLHVVSGADLFADELSSLKKRASSTGILKRHTGVLCGMLEMMEDLVAGLTQPSNQGLSIGGRRVSLRIQ